MTALTDSQDLFEKRIKMNPSQKLGSKIKAARKTKKLSQVYVGRLLDIHQAAVCRIEKGTQNILAIELKTLAKDFGVSVDSFFEGAPTVKKEKAGKL